MLFYELFTEILKLLTEIKWGKYIPKKTGVGHTTYAKGSLITTF